MLLAELNMNLLLDLSPKVKFYAKFDLKMRITQGDN